MRLYYEKVMLLASLAGKILLQSNAEEYRVEDTTYRILKTSGLNLPGSYSNTTGLFLSLTDTEQSQYIFSNIVRINERSNNIQNIDAVNNISRLYVSGNIDVDQAYAALKELKTTNYGDLIDYTNIILAAAFVILFGGTSSDFIVAILTGSVLTLMKSIRKHIYFTNFSYNILSVAIGTLFIGLIYAYFPQNLNQSILLGAMIIPFYPGTSITNSMRDILKGNNLAGSIKAVDAFMIITSLTLGYSIGIVLCRAVISFI